jgi:hypothetical protein
VIEAGQTLVQKLQTEQDQKAAEALAGLFQDAASDPSFIQGMNELEQLINSMLPPRLQEKQAAISQAIIDMKDRGEDFSVRPDIQKQLEDLMSDPDYLAVMKNFMPEDEWSEDIPAQEQGPAPKL